MNRVDTGAMSSAHPGADLRTGATGDMLVEVAVTLPVHGRYHYRVPSQLADLVQIGTRVLVRFGPRKVTGVVVRRDTEPPAGVKPIDITDVLDRDQPALTIPLVDLCLWIADYYEAPPGEVMRAALPAGSGVESRTIAVLTEAGRVAASGRGGALPAKESAMLGKLAARWQAAEAARDAESQPEESQAGEGDDHASDDRRDRTANESRDGVAVSEHDDDRSHAVHDEDRAADEDRVHSAHDDDRAADDEERAVDDDSPHGTVRHEGRDLTADDEGSDRADNDESRDGDGPDHKANDASPHRAPVVATASAAKRPAPRRKRAKPIEPGLLTIGLSKPERTAIAALVERGLVEVVDLRDVARTRLPRERVARLMSTIDVATVRASLRRSAKRLAVFDALAGIGAAATSEAAGVSMSESVAASMSESVAASVSELVAASTSESAAVSTSELAGVSTSELAGVSTSELTGVSTSELAALSMSESVAASVSESVAASVSGSVAASVSESVAASVRESVAASVSESVARPTSESNATAALSATESPSSANAPSALEARASTSAAAAADDVAHRAVSEAISLDALEAKIPGAKTAIRDLVKARIVEVFQREQALVAVDAGSLPVSPPPVLTSEQVVAVAAIIDAMPGGVGASGAPPAFRPVLLHGVTGSGKTEVYLRAIAEALARGRTALVLVPEISLTPQLATRFRARFGDLVAILHSGLSERDRLSEWSRLRRGEATIAVGARSAVFAPIEGLGVIVVDEEHDGSFKQDEGVRYHARDVALVRAQRAGAVCVLGSATPSLESYAHAERGAYCRLVLTQRPTSRPMPEVEVVDLRTYRADGEAMLSAPLRKAIAATLEAGDQAILFLNRRGFATFVLCKACGHAFRCPYCSVSLTYHRTSDRLTCHYCGYFVRVPELCPSCGADAIERKGLGTEKVADSVAEEFPSARVARLDRDVASGAKIEGVLARVARREVDVLVGTQMVTKGHDFPGVTLVGVLCADTGLDLPDFRASERTFQLLAQVAGRAGRGDKPGRVIVQTYRPESPAVVAAAAHDYGQFFAAETAARADLGYPPHGRLIAVRIDGADPQAVAGIAHKLAQLATGIAKDIEAGGGPIIEVRGPVPAPIERVRSRTRWQVWLRGPDRHALRRVARGLSAVEVPAAVRVGLDVDPMSSM